MTKKIETTKSKSWIPEKSYHVIALAVTVAGIAAGLALAVRLYCFIWRVLG
jgi:hypothetical protein